MKKDTGKKEAGNFPKHNTLIMIVSIVTVSLFVGLAVQPAIAQREPAEVIPTDIEGECIPCKAVNIPQPKLPCKTCACAVYYAIGHAKESTKENVSNKLNETDNKIYSGFFTDLALWIAKGIIEGLDKSGFDFEPKLMDLLGVIDINIKEKIEIPVHNLSKIVAALHGILEGVAEYLIDVCNNRSQKTVYEAQVKPIIPPPVKSIIPLKNLLSLVSKAQTGDECHRCKNIDRISSNNELGPISRIIFMILKHIIA